MGDMDITTYSYVLLSHSRLFYFQTGMYIAIGAYVGWKVTECASRALGDAVEWALKKRTRRRK